MKIQNLLGIVTFIVLLLAPFTFASGLEISDIDVEVDGEASDDVDADGGSFEAAPGNSIVITVEGKNTFSASSDNEIRNVDVSIDVDSVCPQDSDDSVEEEIRLDDLDPTVDDSATFRFTVPECADEDNYDVDIRLEGKDDNDVEYVTELTLTMTINKGPSEVTLEFFDPEPAVLECGDLSFSIAVESHNIGSLDEDAGLLIINEDIGVKKFEFMDLRTGRWSDDDTSFSKTYTFTVDDSVDPGEYDIRAEIEYSNNEKEIKRFQTITVPDCDEEVTAEELAEEDVNSNEDSQAGEEDSNDADEEPVTTTSTTTVTIPDTTTESTEVVETKEGGNGFFSIPILAVALIVGLIILFSMLALLVKKK
ncbi:MAG: hypothetical protein AABX98_00245 [Nanoarchaeota archaeon]